MPLPAGTHRLGPENGTLSVRTGRIGAAAMAGHDLLLDVTAWEATLDVGEDPAVTSLVLEADAASLRVLEGAAWAWRQGGDRADDRRRDPEARRDHVPLDGGRDVR